MKIADKFTDAEYYRFGGWEQLTFGQEALRTVTTSSA